jgi:hypothetical protein
VGAGAEGKDSTPSPSLQRAKVGDELLALEARLGMTASRKRIPIYEKISALQDSFSIAAAGIEPASVTVMSRGWDHLQSCRNKILYDQRTFLLTGRTGP